jgi:hypothetical protein
MAFYTLYLGLQRLGALHRRRRTIFRWKRHVVLGYLSLGTWLIGMALGGVMVYLYWHGILITGTHGSVALVMLPFLVFGLVSGLYMDRKRQKRKTLPLLHGLSNLVALILALAQVKTGWWVYKVFVQGG